MESFDGWVPTGEPTEPPFLQNTAWVQHHDHQKALLDAFAEFEANLRHERQMEGIAAAKLRGIDKGRRPQQPQIDPQELRRLQVAGEA